MDDFKEVLDQDSLRTIELANGNKLNIKRQDPYGFWSIHYEKGQIPQELSGVYTDSEHAIAAVKVYLTKQAPQEPAENKKKVSGS